MEREGGAGGLRNVRIGRKFPPPACGRGRGWVSTPVMFRDRDTPRARELRNNATPAERKLWRYLCRSQTGAKFSRQLKVGSFFPDFLCRELKLIIEVDGHSHDVQPDRDVYRDRYLTEAGYRVLHFANADVMENVEGVVTAIQLEIRRLAHP
jgi:very-short-patch-repair endonuclease